MRWLDHHRYPYLYIDQSYRTFPAFFKDHAKRPDFLIAINRVGLIAVDVKDQNPNPNYTIGEDELGKLQEFEEFTRLPVWFVFKDKLTPENRGSTLIWRWLTLSEASRCPIKTNHEKGTDFRLIPKSACIEIVHRDGIGKILEKV